ncbi:YveK family protein [Bacillus sp. 2205SS5-2]|uniref:YveK family protein n=1 Tax=Bacillus sp. 2205SS5-2 TaxID=3109031 RepID=UPI003005D4EE
MDGKTDIKTLFRILLRRKITLVLTTVLFMAISILVSLFVIKPTYESTEYILVGPLQANGEYQEEIEINRLLASTVDLINSPLVLKTVQNQLNIKEVEEIEGIVNVNSNRNSQIITISARHHEAEFVQTLTRSYALTSIEKMNNLLGVESLQILNGSDGVSLKKLGSPFLNMAIGCFIGLFFGISLAMLREHFDDSIKSIEEIETVCSVPIIGELSINPKQRRNGKRWNKRWRAANKNIKVRKRGEIGA